MLNDPIQTPGDSPPPKLRESINHKQAFSYIFENPNWVMNALMVAVCLLSGMVVPIIGQLVMHGYQFAIIEALHLRPGSTYPDFDFDKLADYLVRGLMVFLTTLGVGLLALPVVGLSCGACFALIALAASVNGDGGGIIAAVTVPLLIIGIFVAGIVVNMSLVPFVLRAGLTRDLGKTFDFGFAWQFIRNTWLEMVIAGLVFILVCLVLEIVGLLALCVGVFFTLAFAMLMQAHLGLQLYELHLARGGDRIPIPPPNA